MPRKTKPKAPKQAKATIPDAKRKQGRPSLYTVELAETICALIAESKTLDQVVAILAARETPVSRSAILQWLDKHEAFQRQYARAHELQADHDADQIREITRRVIDPTVPAELRLGANEARVAIDALKWSAGKRMPKKYGDKLTLDGDLTVKMPDDQMDARVMQLLTKAGAAANAASTVH